MQENNMGQLMRAGMRRLASGVCVLSASFSDSDHFAMTVSSVTSVSDSPASLLVCINHQVSKVEALSIVNQTFAINVLADTHQAVSNICAGRDFTEDRFGVGEWSFYQGTPVLKDALVNFICEVDKVVPYGTHNVLIARIIHVTLGTETEASPLLYADGRYGTFA